MMSPGGGYGAMQYDQNPYHHQPPVFPSMSVNVSMNMTMHGYPPSMTDNLQHQMTCPQVIIITIRISNLQVLTGCVDNQFTNIGNTNY